MQESQEAQMAELSEALKKVLKEKYKQELERNMKNF